jgi:tetratricopeptide (TPR) repeat protein
MVVCPRCRNTIADGVRFCPRCGFQQPAAVAAPPVDDGATQLAPSSMPAYAGDAATQYNPGSAPSYGAGGAAPYAPHAYPPAAYAPAPSYGPAYAPPEQINVGYDVPPLPPSYETRRRGLSPFVWAGLGLAILVACAVLGFGGFFSFRQYQLSDYYDKGDAAFRNERWDDAIKNYDEVIRIDGAYRDVKAKRTAAVDQKNLALAYQEGSAMLDAGDYQGALAKLDEVLRANPNYKDAPAKRAQAEKAIKLEAAYAAALDAMAAEQYRTAVEKFDEVLALDPNYKDAQAQRRAAENAQRLTSAYAAALQAIEAARWDAALEQLSVVISLNPGYKDAAARKADIESKRATLAPVSFQLTNRQWAAANYDDQVIEIKNQLGERVGTGRISARYTWENVVDVNEKVFIIGLRLTDQAGNSQTVYLMAHEPSGFRQSAEGAKLVLVRGNGSETLRAGNLSMVVNYQASINPNPQVVVGGRTGTGDSPTFRSYTLSVTASRNSQA